jgi:hypothetical protein
MIMPHPCHDNEASLRHAQLLGAANAVPLAYEHASNERNAVPSGQHPPLVDENSRTSRGEMNDVGFLRAAWRSVDERRGLRLVLFFRKLERTFATDCCNGE